MSSLYLDFLVIGGQKCATSWLYYCLREHPELHLPNQKKEVWYIGGELYKRNGINWYMNLLDGARANQIIGDVSVEYLSDPQAPAELAKHFSNIKFIVSLRDPIDRAISAYYWKLRKKQFKNINLEQALLRGLNSARTDSKQDDVFADIIKRGEYGNQLQHYVNHFGSSNILYILYEEIAHDPLSSLKRIYRYLNCKDNFVPQSLNLKPKKNTYNNLLILLERIASHSRSFGHIFDYSNQFIANIFKSKKKPGISQGLEEELRHYYANSIKTTEALILRAPPEHRPQFTISSVWKTNH